MIIATTTPPIFPLPPSGFIPPQNMMGMEMTIIAAVVLGGVSITGGVGTVIGTILGIGLITIMNNSLLLIGIPSYWQTFFTGAIIIFGTAISAYRLSFPNSKTYSKKKAVKILERG
jgi:simple sugar transport system permease protein